MKRAALIAAMFGYSAADCPISSDPVDIAESWSASVFDGDRMVGCTDYTAGVARCVVIFRWESGSIACPVSCDGWTCHGDPADCGDAK